MKPNPSKEVSIEQLKEDINNGFYYFYNSTKRDVPMPRISKDCLQFTNAELQAFMGYGDDKLLTRIGN